MNQMNSGLISTRYARALLDYAAEMGEQEEVYEKMKLLSEIYLEVSDLRYAIQNQSVSNSEKRAVITTACGGSLPSSFSKMLTLILRNERQEHLLYIALRFVELYREKFHIQYGKLITAVEMDKERARLLTSRIEKIVGGELEVESVVDPAIIGGFVLNLDGFRWDASISGELTRIKSRFS